MCRLQRKKDLSYASIVIIIFNNMSMRDLINEGVERATFDDRRNNNIGV